METPQQVSSSPTPAGYETGGVKIKTIVIIIAVIIILLFAAYHLYKRILDYNIKRILKEEAEANKGKYSSVVAKDDLSKLDLSELRFLRKFVEEIIRAKAACKKDGEALEGKCPALDAMIQDPRFEKIKTKTSGLKSFSDALNVKI